MERLEKLLVASVAIGLAAVVGIILFARLSGVDPLKAAERVDPVLIAGAMLLHVLFWLLWGVRTVVLGRDVGIDIGFFRAQEIVLSSLFAAAITPSYAGGEPVRFFLLSEDGNGGRAGAVVFTERFLDTTFFAGVTLLSVFFLFSYMEDPLLKYSFFGAGVILALALTIFFVSLRSAGVLERILKAVLKPLSLVSESLAGSLENRIEKGVEEFHDSLVRVIKEGKGPILVAGGLTVVMWTGEFLIPYLLFRGLGVDIAVLEAVAGNAMITVLMMIPLTPGGSGLAEVGAVGIFQAFDPSPAVALFPLPWRIVTYYSNMAVGLLVSALVLKDMDLVREKIENYL